MYSSFSYSPLDQQDALLAAIGNSDPNNADSLLNARKGLAIQGYLTQHAKAEATRMNTELEIKKAIRDVKSGQVDYTKQAAMGLAVAGLVWLILRSSRV